MLIVSQTVVMSTLGTLVGDLDEVSCVPSYDIRRARA
jgi:hypothetical protein